MTPDDVLGDLPDYVLGTLPEARRRELATLIAASPELARELGFVREALGALGTRVPSVTPRPEARRALLAALDTSDRFAPFFADLMRHLDLGKDALRKVLGYIDDATRWEPGPMPGIQLIHFAGGPNTVAPDTGFVMIARGTAFPYHRHIGHEVNYVLQGAIRDGDGTLYLPGESIEMAPGTSHDFSVPDDADLLVVVVQAGFDVVEKP